jgi:hypothetical protein
MTHHEIVLDHPSQLNALSALPLKRFVAPGSIRLGGSLAGHPQRELWEKQINASYRACGCNESSLGLGAGLIAGGLYAASGAAESTIPWLSTTVIVIGAAIAGAALGKLAGRVRANMRLQRTINTIRPHWKDEGPTSQDILVCG